MDKELQKKIWNLLPDEEKLYYQEAYKHAKNLGHHQEAEIYSRIFGTNHLLVIKIT